MMGWLARQDGYDPNAFDVPLEQSTGVGWANRLGEILTTRPPDNPAVAYKTPYFDITEGDIGRATEAALGGMTVTPKGIKAYHSSPHDFDKFDLAKIGTGEGAQVYGHGLYFAESPAVSGQGGQYWNQFSERFKDLPTPEGMATRALVETKADRAAAIAKLSDPKYQAHLKGFLPNSRFKDVDPREALKLLESDKPVGPRTYEVNINADPAHMLDWDKALYQQPEVYEKIRSHAGQVKEMGLQDAYKHFLDAAELKGMPGSDFYQIARKHGPEALSQDLREAGIPGIKYLDQGSRKLPASSTFSINEKLHQLSMTNDPAARAVLRAEIDALQANPGSHRTSNYVVFDPGIIDIMKKYGIAGATAVPVMGSLASEGNYQTEERY